ncbi:MAG TPA: class I SAM-dependent methyltransferase [Pyrinomonadaceae bacterium]|nr:class I SAM-dependent methyltransferase [Pyrinomonadaceae bacterium]
MLKLYSALADWWPLLSPPEDYVDEAEFFLRLFSEAELPPSPSLLELGSGGGSNAFHLKKHFAQMTLTDLLPHMLAISRTLNPECEHLEGDMRTLRLGREFDVIFVHDAIDYMTTAQDLRQAMGTAFIHCRAGGVALFVPDHVRETFQPSTQHGGRDGDGRALRYLEWTYDPDENDSTYVTEFAYLLREGDQPARMEHEQHVCGLFPRSEWLRLLSEVGFQAEVVPDPYDRDILVAYRPRG